MDFSDLGPGNNHLKHDDLRGLINLTRLDLSGLGLSAFDHADGTSRLSLPGGMFSEMTNLEYLSLADNDIFPRLRPDVFEGLSNLTELDLRGFSRNPAGRTGSSRNGDSVGKCWTNQEQAWIHPQYPWNPRTGSPEAFAPLTSLVTYNWDAEFDTSGIREGDDPPGFTYTPAPYAASNYSLADPPTNVQASVVSGQVSLSWDAPAGATGITGYRIERDLNGHGGDRKVRNAAGSSGRQGCGTNNAQGLWSITLFDRLGERAGTTADTSFTDALSHLSTPERDQMRSLKYHVVALTADGESMPVRVSVPTSSFRRYYTGGFAALDTTAYEGPGATLDFTVEIIPVPRRTVTVDYETSPGSATAGTDYTHTSGKLRFLHGELRKTVRVAVIDDNVEDSGETVMLVLSNPTGLLNDGRVRYVPSGITRATATGWIFNSEEPVVTRTPATTEEDEAEGTNNPATGAPTISGTAQAGQTLMANTDGISDADGLDDVSYEYQWLADDTDIEDATGETYNVSDDDVGKTIKVRVSFSDDADNRESLTSAATASVTARPNTQATGAPTISGTAQVGLTLTASTEGITDDDGLTNPNYSYQWLADDVDIDGSTGSSYKLTSGEQGKTIKVRVSFEDDAGNKETLTSEATETVAPPPLTVSITTAAPATHGGSTDEFFFDIAFSEEPKSDFSYEILKFHAFDVAGGTILKAQRLQKDPKSNIPWQITVKPDDNGDVTVVLPVTTDCDNDDGAICTDDGRMLSKRLEFTVTGPGD